MFLFAVIIYWMDRFEKEPRRLLVGVFLWGVVIAAAGAFIINTVFGVGIYLVTDSEGTASMMTGTLIAPIVEEVLKGCAVFLVFLSFRSEFDSVMDGIVYSSVAALGFAATENLHYIYDLGFLEGGWEGLFSMALIRDVVVSWQHPFYTAFTGIGFALARLNKNIALKITAPLLGLGVAIFLHSLHNTLAGLGDLMCLFGSLLDWSGWLLMLVFILVMVRNERKLLIRFLGPEVEEGLISPQQYQNSISPRQRSQKLVSSLFHGKYRITSRFYQLCSDLAHKKNQLEKFGNEGGNFEMISNLKKEIKFLAALE